MNLQSTIEDTGCTAAEIAGTPTPTAEAMRELVGQPRTNYVVRADRQQAEGKEAA